MVRMATKEDIPNIIYLGKQLDDNYKKNYHMDSILNGKYDRVFVYEEDKIYGFLHILELTQSVDIINIVVDQTHQGRGIASLLMDYMFSNVDNNIKIFTLEVAVDNDKAIKLYEKFGFEIKNKREKYYKDKDAYLMGREV